MVGQTINYDERMKENTLDGEELLGGEGVVVEIDGCKIGKWKYIRGRLAEGVWLLGLV